MLFPLKTKGNSGGFLLSLPALLQREKDFFRHYYLSGRRLG
jgi:hypothetical protein